MFSLIKLQKTRTHIHIFLPPANEVWGKVMFLHLCVILFTGGSTSREVVCIQGQTPSSGVGRPPPPIGYYGIRSTSGLFFLYLSNFYSFIPLLLTYIFVNFAVSEKTIVLEYYASRVERELKSFIVGGRGVRFGPIELR